MYQKPAYTDRLESEFKACRKLLNAVGDETRQHLLCTMIRTPDLSYRVVELASQTNLSRPAISHHMQILKEAGIVRSFKRGTCVYYCLDPDASEMERLYHLSQDVLFIINAFNEKEGCTSE